MASKLSPPMLILLSSAAGAAAVKFVFTDYLPRNGLVAVFVPLVAAGFALYAFYLVFIYPFFVSALRGLPEPRASIPIIAHGMATFAQPRGESFLTWMREVPNDGLIRFRGFFNTDRVLLTSPAALKELLLTKAYAFEKPRPLRTILTEFLGDGLICVEGEEHKFLRKNLMPAFSFRHIKEMYPMFWSKAVELTEGVTEQIEEEGDVVEVNNWGNKVTMDIISLAAMGKDSHALDRKGKEDELVHNYEKLLEPTWRKQLFMILGLTTSPHLLRLLPLPTNFELANIKSNLNRICMKLLGEKKQLIEQEPEGQKDILSLCLRTKAFGDEQLVNQLLTFLAAGHETTSSAFTWTTYFLARDPALQEALRKEIYENVPAPGTETPDTDLCAILDSLPLLNGVANETLRFYPTVPLTVRFAPENTTLLGHPIPKDTQLILCPWATNRNPDLWGPDALEFNPERWIDVDEKTGKRRPNNSGGAPSNYALLTFLHGPRSCIGQEFAKAELRCILAAFVARFELKLRDEKEVFTPAGVVTTKPKHGMHLKLRRLNAWEQQKQVH